MTKCLLIGLMIIGLLSCSKKKSGQPQPVIIVPDKALLVYPDDNQYCTLGTDPIDSVSTIQFSWNPANNANNYELYIKNLLTNRPDSLNTRLTQLNVPLKRSTPYAWFVVSHSSKSSRTSTSDVRKFYNAGPGALTYVPFPADLVSPGYGQTISNSSGTVKLYWQGSVVNGDQIESYDVYLGTTNTPPLVAGAVTANSIDGITVNAQTTYYWKIITRNKAGNISDSGISYFTVQ